MTDLRKAIARALGETYDGYADPVETPNNWGRALSGADAALAAIEAAGYTLCPPGWQAVPKEPTEEMVIAGDENNPTVWNDGCDEMGVEVALEVYKAMLAAAPKPGGET